jgi:hypothetical protein
MTCSGHAEDAKWNKKPAGIQLHLAVLQFCDSITPLSE